MTRKELIYLYPQSKGEKKTMTEKQRKFIIDICDVLHIDFDECKNFTKTEASEFIAKNIDEYRAVWDEMQDAYYSWALEHGYF